MTTQICISVPSPYTFPGIIDTPYGIGTTRNFLTAEHLNLLAKYLIACILISFPYIYKAVSANWVFSPPTAINSKKTETNEKCSTNNKITRNMVIGHHLEYKLITLSMRSSIAEQNILMSLSSLKVCGNNLIL